MRTASLLTALALCLSTVARADEATDRPTRPALTPRACDEVMAMTPAPRPIYTKWYFWTAIGATLTASVAASIALATAPAPKLRTEQDICVHGCNACIGLSCGAPR